MIILKVILIIVLVLILAFIFNGIEDYHKENSLIRLSFADKFGRLKLPIVSLVNNGAVFNFLIDSGATCSIIDTPFLEQMKYKKLEAEGMVEKTIAKGKEVVDDIKEGTEGAVDSIKKKETNT